MLNLSDLISQSLDIVRIQIKNKPIEIITNLPSDKYFSLSDEIRLCQILINLPRECYQVHRKVKIKMNLEILELNSENKIPLFAFSVIDTGIGISTGNPRKDI